MFTFKEKRSIKMKKLGKRNKISQRKHLQKTQKTLY